MINGLSRWGARVIHKDVAKVHVSGHAPAGELLYLLNAARPSNVMPVHGEWRHLRAHAELAIATGVARDRVLASMTAWSSTSSTAMISVAGQVACGYVYVDGRTSATCREEQLKDRRILGDEGFISIIVVVDSTTGKAGRRPGHLRPRLHRATRRLRAGT